MQGARISIERGAHRETLWAHDLREMVAGASLRIQCPTTTDVVGKERIRGARLTQSCPAPLYIGEDSPRH